ncbi:MAG: nicotinate phosphoribosyltransferase [archaeon]|nr:nicotinate phosphoribosyltransferase [archaeon]
MTTMTEKKIDNRAMLTDLYQLTMNAAYFRSRKNDKATFDLFIRKLPQDWGFFIANGIEDAVDYATNLSFEDEDIEYLGGQGLFDKSYLDSLKNFRFTGDIHAVREGTPIAPNTPLVRVTAPRMEAQLLETMLLNTINFQTMIATKANRVVNAASPARVVDFGLRRAQEKDAAMKGARAAFIGGAVATSNVLAGKEYGIPISGTQAHSFVMSFPSEIEAFRAYAETFPNNSTLLVDTYDTLQGARNAAVVGKELEARGKRLGAVRLDSGDLADLSKRVRVILDNARLQYVKILASNDLNEYKIAELNKNGARIDGFGVGTELITAKPVAAIGGVYKLVEDIDGAKIKLSSDKKTYPGKKQVYRFSKKNGFYSHDVLALEGEGVDGKPLLEKFVANGERIRERMNLKEIRAFCLGEVVKMPESARALVATPYELKTSVALERLVEDLSTKYGGRQ